MTVGLVHLVRERNGPAPFERFIESYRQLTGGKGHELILLMKGFQDERIDGRYHEAVATVPHRMIFVADRGLDIGAYFAAAAACYHDLLCFVNSFSVIRDQGWLEKLERHARSERVGLVGATGSYGSVYSYARFEAGLPSPYESCYGAPEPRLSRRLTLGVPARLHAWRMGRRFGPFPAPHVRTNAFMIRRETFLRARRGALRSKLATMAFESGRDGLTAQLRAAGLDALVVGCDGIAYGPGDWPESHTFWRDQQENLLVADNQTAEYEAGSSSRRLWLSRYAWGDRARAADSPGAVRE